MLTYGFNYLSLGGGHVLANNMIPSIFDKDPVRHLVGEASQNSIDAARRLGLRARLSFLIHSVSRSALDTFDIASVERHAAACSEHDIAEGLDGDRVRLLNFEDNSGGLDGDNGPNIDLKSPLGRFNFSVGSGIDGKAGIENGRHGLGSGSGAAVSNVRTMMFTTTRSDFSTVASGRLSLATHTLDGVSYAPEARLGVFEDGEWKGVLEGDQADHMHRELGFTRPLDMPGLSCAIVDPVSAINGYSLLGAMLSWQFHQIAGGEIEFSIRDESSALEIELSAENIDEIIRSDLFRATQHALRRRRQRLQQSILEDLPELLAFTRSYPGTESMPAVTTDELKSVALNLRKDWVAGKPVGMALRLSGEHSVTGSASGTVGSHVAPLKGNACGYDLHIRDSIMTIRKATGRMSMTVSKGDGIAVLLGDSEDPAHLNFMDQYAKKRGWTDYKDAIRTFKGAPELIHMAMSGEADKGDRLSLAAFFPMPGKDVRSKGQGGPEDETSDDLGPVVIDGAGGSDELFSYRQDRRSSTLTLTLTATAKQACEDGDIADLSIIAEYARSKPGYGSFTDSNTVFSVERGAESHMVTGNELAVFGIHPELKIVIRNVDFNRDLRLKSEAVIDMENAA